MRNVADKALEKSKIQVSYSIIFSKILPFIRQRRKMW